MDTIARGEMVEAELDAMIRRRDEKRRETEGERRTEELWQASARIHDAKLQREQDAQSYDFHRQQIRRLRATLGSLIRDHERALMKLEDRMENGGGA